MSKQLAEWDAKHLLHPFTSIKEHMENGPHVMAQAKGIRLTDTGGREYIDAMAGLWCVNAGYGRPEIVEAVRKQMEAMCYYHSFMALANEPAIELAHRLTEMAPGDLTRAFFCNSGSEANDTHVKLIWYYNNLRGKPEKKKIISRKFAYHGVTVASGSMSGIPTLHQSFDLPLERFIHVTKPHHYWEAMDGESEANFSKRLAEELEETIDREGADTIAAFIAEPVMAAGGVVPPPEGYFEAIVPILRKHDILFLADEVVCGFGRLGTPFGSNKFNLEPDLMTVAKGLTSGYVPMAACLISEKVWEVLRDKSDETGPFAHGYTYTAHPVAAAAALANLDIIESERLVDNAATVGDYFQQKLDDVVKDNVLVGEKRGLGLIAGVELVQDKDKKIPFDLKLGVAKRLYKILLDHSLICRPIMNTMAFSPPLILTESDADDIIERFAQGLARLADQLAREGVV